MSHQASKPKHGSTKALPLTCLVLTQLHGISKSTTLLLPKLLIPSPGPSPAQSPLVTIPPGLQWSGLMILRLLPTYQHSCMFLSQETVVTAHGDNPSPLLQTVSHTKPTFLLTSPTDQYSMDNKSPYQWLFPSMMIIASLFQTPFFQLTLPKAMVSKPIPAALHPSLPPCHLEPSLCARIPALVPSLTSHGNLTQLKRPVSSLPQLASPLPSQSTMSSLMMTLQNTWHQLHAQSDLHGSPSPLHQDSTSTLLISPTSTSSRWLSVKNHNNSVLPPNPSQWITTISIIAQPLTGTLDHQLLLLNSTALLPKCIAIFLSPPIRSKLTLKPLMRTIPVVFNKYFNSKKCHPMLATTHGPPFLSLTLIVATLSSKWNYSQEISQPLLSRISILKLACHGSTKKTLLPPSPGWTLMHGMVNPSLPSQLPNSPQKKLPVKSLLRLSALPTLSLLKMVNQLFCSASRLTNQTNAVSSLVMLIWFLMETTYPHPTTLMLCTSMSPSIATAKFNYPLTSPTFLASPAFQVKSKARSTLETLQQIWSSFKIQWSSITAHLTVTAHEITSDYVMVVSKRVLCKFICFWISKSFYNFNTSLPNFFLNSSFKSNYSISILY